MFIWSISSIEDALKKHAPIIYELMNNLYLYACENKILIEWMNIILIFKRFLLIMRLWKNR